MDNITEKNRSNGDANIRRAKHIEIRYYYAIKCTANHVVRARHVQSSENIADGFTKPLNRNTFEVFRDRIGVRPMLQFNPKGEC